VIAMVWLRRDLRIRDHPALLAAATIEALSAPREVRVPATGAVSSLQEVELGIRSEAMARLWQPEGLERLARSYWLYLRHASLGAIRVVYKESSTTVVLLARGLALLRFAAPEYETSAEAASVTWRIERGLLVAARGRGSGWLRIEVRRIGNGAPASERGARERLRVGVEVRNFYPWLRGTGSFARLGAWIYAQTQVRVHRRITIGFLRSLASLEMPPTRHAADGPNLPGR
jgi:hypothetical protein